MAVAEKVKSIIVEQLGVDEEEVSSAPVDPVQQGHGLRAGRCLVATLNGIDE